MSVTVPHRTHGHERLHCCELGNPAGAAETERQLVAFEKFKFKTCTNSQLRRRGLTPKLAGAYHPRPNGGHRVVKWFTVSIHILN